MQTGKLGFLIFYLTLLNLVTSLAAQDRWEIPRREGEIVVDGFLREWDSVPPLVLAPGEEGVGQGGDLSPDDVRVELRGAWDSEYLYLALRWEDSSWDLSEVTRGDAVWIDPENKRRDRMFFFDFLKFHIRESDYDYTLWMAPRIDDEGPFFWHRLLEGYRGMERASGLPMITARDDEGEAAMEVMLVWEQLRREPKPEDPIPLTLILSDSDYRGRLLEFKLDHLKWLVWRGEIKLEE